MHGRVIFINPLTSTGLIFGADRERYSFPTSEWTEPGLPARNTEVSFKVKGDQALKVRPFSLEDMAGDDLSDTLDDLMPGAKAAARPSGAAAADMGATLSPDFLNAGFGASTAASSDHGWDGSADGEKDLEPSDFALDDALMEHDPKVLKARRAAELETDTDAVGSPRASWKSYLLGILALLILVAIGVVVTRLKHH